MILLRKKEEENLVHAGRKRVITLSMVISIFLCTSINAFADVGNIGENTGGWLLDQLWWIALAATAFMVVKYMLKKAWVQMGIFLVIGGIALVIIGAPERLQVIGETLFGIITK